MTASDASLNAKSLPGSIPSHRTVALSRSRIVFILCAVGLLCFPTLIRQGFLGTSRAAYNPFFILAFVLCISVPNFKEIKISSLVGVAIFIFLSLSAWESNSLAGYSRAECFKAFLTLNLPLLMLLFWRMLDFENDWVLHFVQIFNVVMIAIAAFAVINLLAGGALVRSLVYFSDRSVDTNLNRLWTPYGHPLYNAALFLVFFCVNTFYKKQGKELLPPWLVLVISAIGILTCASKSAFGLFILLAFIWYITDIRMLLFALALSIILYVSGAFDFVLSRFSDFSSGRFDAWDYLVNRGILQPFGTWRGYGISAAFELYTDRVSWASAAFEFPVLGYSLAYGTVYTGVLYLFIFVYPLVVLLRYRSFDYALAFIAVAIHMNMYNGLYLVADYFAAFIIFTVFLLLSARNTAYLSRKDDLQ